MVVATVNPAGYSWDDESYNTAAEQPDSLPKELGQAMEVGVSVDVDERKNPREEGETLSLPPSSHCFLFTEPVGSLPFVLCIGIALISNVCLALALANNLASGEIPVNVGLSIGIAKYLAILIALLMEEEIPTGLWLLRSFPKPLLKSIFPEVCYTKFVISSLLRITSGYLFLVNVLVVLIQADEVIVIFYDVLALQFIQQLDDICFKVARMEVLGERLQHATTTKYFHTTFQKEKGNDWFKWRSKLFLKTLYFVNLVVFLSVMLVISAKQATGYYQCKSIHVDFGDLVWKDSIVRWPPDSKQYPPGLIEKLVLSYSYFNGVFEKEEGRVHEGRPVYVEMKKSDRTPFDATAPDYDPYDIGSPKVDRIVPAEIKYCNGRWVFSHPYIRKSRRDLHDDSACNWLARSEETDGYDLLDVGEKWQLWVGKIVDAKIDITCNICSDDNDCNLNGECNEGTCECFVDDEAAYLGTHCEVKLEETCRTIIGEHYGDVWEVDVHAFSEKASGQIWKGQQNKQQPFSEYSRAVYTYVEGLPPEYAPVGDDSLSLIYSGSRWFMINLERAKSEMAADFWAWQTSNYHAYWARAYTPGVTDIVSDPTTNDSPVGVDFYYVGERDNQYGPYGLLYPAQINNMTGRGYYRCNVKQCSICANSTGFDGDLIIPKSVPLAGGLTCGFIQEWYHSEVDDGTPECEDIGMMVKDVCCPGS